MAPSHIAVAGPAAQAVFGTYELVERIISYLPPKVIFNVMDVAKAWETIILRSRLITLARVVDPRRTIQLRLQSQLEAWVRNGPTSRRIRREQREGRDHFVSYEDELLVHGLLRLVERRDYNMTFWDLEDMPDEAFELDSRYITEPPISTMWLQVRRGDEFVENGCEYLSECTIRIPLGITIRDLRETRARLLEAVTEDPEVRVFARFASSSNDASVSLMSKKQAAKALATMESRSGWVRYRRRRGRARVRESAHADSDW